MFARAGRSHAEGAFATCHCLTLPPSEPGYYFWRDRDRPAASRADRNGSSPSRRSCRSGTRRVKYMISFALPRFCDQSLDRSRKERFYPGAEPWIAKLDTVVHELYHIDPEHNGIRRIERGDGTYSAHCHGHRFFEAGRRHGDDLPRQPGPIRPSTISCGTISRRSSRATAASSARLPDVSLVPAALHRAPAEPAAVRRRQRRRRRRAAARQRSSRTLHGRRSARPAVSEGDLAATVRKGQFRRLGSLRIQSQCQLREDTRPFANSEL